MSFQRSIASLVLFLLILAPVANGQDRDRGRDGGRGSDRDGQRSYRERDGDRDRGRDFDPRDILRAADDNNDGIVDPSEVGSRSGYYIRRAAERAGLDASKPIPVAKLAPALEAMRAEGNGGQSSSGSSSSGNSNTAAPAVAGFGEASTVAKAADFSVPLTVNATTQLTQRFDQRVIDYVNEMLRERDANKNGILEQNEWTGRWATPAADSDTNKDGVLDMQELCVRISNRFNIGRPSSTSTSSGPASPAASTTPTSSASPSTGDSDRFRRYAEGFIRQYDANKDGKLDRDEASKMRPEHQAADTNKDGIITVEEMQAKLQSYSASSTSGGSSSDRDGGRGGDGDRSRRSGYGYGSRGSSESENKDNKAAGPRKSFRISSPTDRLPKGLPDWFLRSDGNADGQVSMAEYTTSWTEQLAAEFARNDLNGDGIITPEECLAER